MSMDALSWSSLVHTAPSKKYRLDSSGQDLMLDTSNANIEMPKTACPLDELRCPPFCHPEVENSQLNLRRRSRSSWEPLWMPVAPTATGTGKSFGGDPAEVVPVWVTPGDGYLPPVSVQFGDGLGGKVDAVELHDMELLHTHLEGHGFHLITPVGIPHRQGLESFDPHEHPRQRLVASGAAMELDAVVVRVSGIVRSGADDGQMLQARASHHQFERGHELVDGGASDVVQHLGQVLPERIVHVTDHGEEIARLARLIDLVDAMLPIEL